MKSLLTAIVIFIATIIPAFGEMTNGAFFVDADVECHMVASNGAMTTNQFLAGNTYGVDEQYMLEMDISKPTLFCFAGGPSIQVASNSTLIINRCRSEVKNLNASPRKAEFGLYDISLGFKKGEFLAIAPDGNTNSMFEVYTDHTDKPYPAGRYAFFSDEKETTVNIIKGTSIGGKLSPSKSPTRSKTKTTTSTKPLTPEEIVQYNTLIDEVEKQVNNVLFVVIDGNIKGIWMK